MTDRHRHSLRTPPARPSTWLVALLLHGTAHAAPVALSDVPLFLTSSSKANVLMLYGNSNSMDGDASGAAVGSDAPGSKSEISRAAVKAIIDRYTGVINLGLLAYRQHTSGGDQVRLMQIHDSQYDVSYDPTNFAPAANPPRDSTVKKFRVPNPSSPGDFIHYNVALPFYDKNPQGTGFCWSSTAKAFNNGEHPVSGPWDTYNCYRTKTGPSDAAAPGGGYADPLFNGKFMPTDSDLGQGITDFGSRLTWKHVGPAWFSNGSPGPGYVHVPIAALDGAQAARLKTKLGTSQFAVNAPYDPNYPLQNAGLSPLIGTVATAADYFDGKLTDPAQGGPLHAPPESCRKNFLVMLTDGLPSVDRTGTPSADTAKMLKDLADQTSDLRRRSGTTSYVLGFALPYGVNPAQLDTIASAGGTGTSYYATDPDALNAHFSTIFQDILARTAAASSVALNTHSVGTGSRVYQARFSSRDWSGQLLSLPIRSDGTLGTAEWDAGQVLNAKQPDSRVIVTRKPSTGRGVAFRWPANPAAPSAAEIDAAQANALNVNPATAAADGNGAARLAYLRGDPTHEGAGLGFRPRPLTKLGDIVDSAPAHVGVPRFNHPDASYRSFRSLHKDRRPMIYVGANDGMLHGFDAQTGEERLAYVPSNLYGKLPLLTSPGYSHRYFVNGSPNVADAVVGTDWRTLLASGMGAGARGIFVLDVTDPSGFSEAKADKIVRFEFNETHDPDVGHVMGPPTIARLNNGRWAAIFGNGYNGTGSGAAALFVVDVETGVLVRKLTAGSPSPGTPNALATPIAVDADGDRTADYVYAGDLQGNLWKFDLRDDKPVRWAVAFSNKPLYTARDGSGNPQPITTAPDVGTHPVSGLLVFVGTGKYVEAADVGDTRVQTMYAIHDDGAQVTGPLVQQTVTSTFDSAGETYRVLSNNPVDWKTAKGWYLNLPEAGERVVSDPILHNGRVIFTSSTPSTEPCSYGGSSWVMELDYATGGMIKKPIFDTDGDGRIDANDQRTGGRKIRTLGSAPSIQQGFGLRSSPLETKYVNQSSGEITNILETGDAGANRRTAWRQLQ